MRVQWQGVRAQVGSREVVAGIARRALGVIADPHHLALPAPSPEQLPQPPGVAPGPQNARELVEGELLRQGVSARAPPSGGGNGRDRCCEGRQADCVGVGADEGADSRGAASEAQRAQPQVQRHPTAATPGPDRCGASRASCATLFVLRGRLLRAHWDRGAATAHDQLPAALKACSTWSQKQYGVLPQFACMPRQFLSHCAVGTLPAN